MKFQPTLPMRGATSLDLQHCMHRNISTHAPHAGSDHHIDRARCALRRISTHAPHAGSDLAFLFEACLIDGFQPTLPMRGATHIAL